MGVGPIGNSGMVPSFGERESYEKQAFSDEHLTLPPPGGPLTENRSIRTKLDIQNLLNPLVRDPLMNKLFAVVLANLREGGKNE